MRSLRLLLAVALTTFSTAEACAAGFRPMGDLSPCINADALQPHANSGLFSAIDRTATLSPRQPGLGLVTSFPTRPIGMAVASPDRKGSVFVALARLLDVTVLFSCGIWDGLGLTVAMPTAIDQRSTGLAEGHASATALVRDIRFGFGLAVRRNVGQRRLTASVEFGLPSGASSAFTRAVTLTPGRSFVVNQQLGGFTRAAKVASLHGSSSLVSPIRGSHPVGVRGVSADVLGARRFIVGAAAFTRPTLVPRGVSTLVSVAWIASVGTDCLRLRDWSPASPTVFASRWPHARRSLRPDSASILASVTRLPAAPGAHQERAIFDERS